MISRLIISGATGRRSHSRALLASLGSPGLGQLYTGRMSRGILFSLSTCLAALLVPFGLLARPERPSLSVAALMALLYLAILFTCHLDAVMGARAITSYALKKYNQPAVYLLFTAGTLLLHGIALLTVASFYSVMTVRTDAMEPSLFRGETVLVARGPGISWKAGDAVVFDDGGAIGLGRVTALPGDRVYHHRGRLAVNGSFLSLGIFQDRDLARRDLPASEDLYYEIHGDRRYALRINLEKNQPPPDEGASKTADRNTIVLSFDNRVAADAPLFTSTPSLRGRVEGVLFGKSWRRILLPAWDTP